jgi:DNA (cytosine-5)-methyltransferase 1
MSDLKIGSLFSGVGGLDLGVQSVLGGHVAWHVEIEKAPSKVLAHHWPNTPNYGDITSVNWAQVEPIDILTGGFPCQDVSLAGSRAGLNDATRSGLWAHYAHAIAALKPKLVVIENVRGLLSAEAVGAMESDPWGMGNGEPRSIINALGAVLGDLAGLGYDTRWCGVRAADAGAPHGRYRVFIIAHPGGKTVNLRAGLRQKEQGGIGGRRLDDDSIQESASTANTCGLRGDESDHLAGQRGESANRASVANEHSPRPRGTEWGAYEPAVRRWEQVLGRTSPPPTNPDGRDMQHRLSPEFVEWMMGLPDGHVTAPSIGLTRNQQLKALGNGVVPAQCALALQELGL